MKKFAVILMLASAVVPTVGANVEAEERTTIAIVTNDGVEVTYSNEGSEFVSIVATKPEAQVEAPAAEEPAQTPTEEQVAGEQEEASEADQEQGA